MLIVRYLRFALASLLLANLVFFQPTMAAESCKFLLEDATQILKSRNADLPARANVAKALAEFAAEHKLPARWIEVGPPERRVKRLFVAVDVANPVIRKAYLDRFNLDSKINDEAAGTLVLEFAKESKEHQYYITGVLRPSADPEAQVYRWGRPDLGYDAWWKTWIKSHGTQEHTKTGIWALAHLIELSPAERENVKFYLQHSNVEAPSPIVAPCKSNNCVAWTSSIELGQTAEGATTEQRKFLFNELGVARAMAHFEIGRRLVHAATDRHNAIAVLVEGELGLNTFTNSFEDYLVPEPKISYSSILKDVVIKSPAAQAVSTIPDGAKIFIPIAAGASPEGFAALIDHAMGLKKGLDVHVLVNGIGANDVKKAVETTDGKLRIHALFLGSNLRELYSEGKVSVIPGNLSDFTRTMRDPKQDLFQYDAILVRVSKPNDRGEYSLGPNNDMIMTVIRNRPGIKIIAEVNEKVPFTTGRNIIREDQIFSKFESKTELAGPAAVPPNAIDAQIGKYLGQLVDSNATLQIGIGNIFSGVPDGLEEAGKKGIKISTEMFGDPMMEMLKRGIADQAETGFAYGSNELYRWLDRNDKVKFVETEYVNSPGRVARTKKFHAINTALQVNLFGEVNATMGPKGRISSPGGQVEFMSGAARSIGGKAIIAIRSTAKNGQLSSIVLNLYPGPITTPHESVTHVVTEYGIAELAGKSERERAINLIKIAHPEFRAKLAEQALERKMIQKSDVQELGK